MTAGEVRSKVTELLALPTETEWAEFNHAEQGYPTDKVGE